MKQFLKSYWKTLLFFTLAGLFGGFFVGIYTLDSYPADIQQQLMAELNAKGLGQLPIRPVLGVISAYQAAGYGLILGAVGIFLAKKIGLWRDERAITPKPLTAAIVISVIGGLALILPDLFFFGKYSEAIMNSYAIKPTVSFLIATVTYAAVIEEVMLNTPVEREEAERILDSLGLLEQTEMMLARFGGKLLPDIGCDTC